jgi:hypothetical protein
MYVHRYVCMYTCNQRDSSSDSLFQSEEFPMLTREAVVSKTREKLLFAVSEL